MRIKLTFSRKQLLYNYTVFIKFHDFNFPTCMFSLCHALDQSAEKLKYRASSEIANERKTADSDSL